MAKVLPVKLNQDWIYDIVLEDSFGKLAEELAKLYQGSSRKFCIVSDSNVAPLHLESLKSALGIAQDKLFEFIFEAGEASKNLDTVSKLYEHLILNHFDRQDVLIAFGGGVVGDLTGFTAATYLRGIDFIQIPTTLLSQVDSSVGGKTGVDFQQYKNMVGAFYQPKLVYMNLSLLKTLPEKQLISGLGEVLKHGLIKNKEYFNWMCENAASVKKLDFATMEEVVYQSCLIKRDVVERDAKELGERALLNFGHTIGHAIEKLSDFSLYHGECVGLGCIAAAYLSNKQGNISEEELQFIEKTFQDFGFRTSICGYDANEILKATKSDKKMVGSKVKFILLQDIGNAYIYRDLTDEDILVGIRYVLQA
ncbi:MAG: 3-dehydroquinate synthase [Roseburia sp.]